ncbi:uncharacterized protein LOC112202843 isoform X2 [Rosa chinensis]|nr:uncharacterized protein LOC112202843 isoform X2 [Rosa chinensis]
MLRNLQKNILVVLVMDWVVSFVNIFLVSLWSHVRWSCDFGWRIQNPVIKEHTERSDCAYVSHSKCKTLPFITVEEGLLFKSEPSMFV